MNIEFEPDTAVRFRANNGLHWDAATQSLWYAYIGLGEDTHVEDGPTYYHPGSTQSPIGLTFGWMQDVTAQQNVRGGVLLSDLVFER